MGWGKTVYWSCCPLYWYLVCSPFPIATPSLSYPSPSIGPSVPSSSSVCFHSHSSQHSNLSTKTLFLFQLPVFFHQNQLLFIVELFLFPQIIFNQLDLFLKFINLGFSQTFSLSLSR